MNMKTLSPPQSGRVGNVVYVLSRYGQLVRQFVPPRNPQTPRQQANRQAFAAVASRWRTLVPDQRTAWALAAANCYTCGRRGPRVPLNGYNYYVKINAARAAKGLGRLDLPPPIPTFSPNPVAELAATSSGGLLRLQLRVPSPPAHDTLVYGAAPVSPGVSCVQHFVFLGFLPPAVEGWSDVSALYAACYGQPAPGKAVYLRTCQQMDGWTDTPKEVSALLPAG